MRKNSHRGKIIGSSKEVFGYYVCLNNGFEGFPSHYIYTFQNEIFEVKKDSVCRNTYVEDWTLEFFWCQVALTAFILIVFSLALYFMDKKR